MPGRIPAQRLAEASWPYRQSARPPCLEWSPLKPAFTWRLSLGTLNGTWILNYQGAMDAIKHWPMDERPREKLLARGPQALSDAELLAIFLNTGVPGKTAVDLARELLTKFKGLRGLLGAGREQLCAAPGLGPAKYARLQAVLELSLRHLGESLQRGNLLQDPQSSRSYIITRLRDRPREVFCCLYLDNRH